MTVNKITTPPTPQAQIDKINEIIDNLGGGLPSQTGNANKFLTTDGTDASWSAVPTRNIGEIISSTIPLTDAGLHLLDGSLIQGDGIYSAFVTYIAGLVSDYPDLFITEADWQTAVTTYGACGKFVYDSVNNTIRLPKITGIIEGTTDVTALGDLIEAGLPTHTHTRGTMEIAGSFGNMYSGNMSASGAFYTASRSGKRSTGADSGNCAQWVFAASRNWSGSTSAPDDATYGNSTTVQPQTIKVLYYIVIATSTKTSIQVDIDEIATDLNGKADVDLTNCTKPHIVETYVNGTSWYRVWSPDYTGNKWCEQGDTVPFESGINIVSVSFLKSFTDIPNLQVSSVTSNGSFTDAGLMVFNLSTTGFTKQYRTNVGYGWSWKACGYIN